jgi:hypothetical protein
MLNRYERLVVAVDEVADSMFPVDERVLLGCFGRDLAGVRHQTQLRLALRARVTPRPSPRSSSVTARFLSAKPVAGTGSGDAIRSARCAPGAVRSTRSVRSSASPREPAVAALFGSWTVIDIEADSDHGQR